MTFRKEKSLSDNFVDFLSIITIAICFILKVPQIINILKVKNAQGISILGLVLELSRYCCTGYYIKLHNIVNIFYSYTIMCLYNYRNNYALLSYLEYPIILLQEFILIYLVLYYKSRLNSRSSFAACFYILISLCFFLGYFPRGVLTFLVVSLHCHVINP